MSYATVIVLAAAVAVQAPGGQPDWTAVQAEAVKTLQGYVRINTSNPPGDVTKAADFLAGVLQREGIGVKRFESGAGRVILLARLKGTGSGKAIA